jgi:hypothetical protein
MDVFLMSLNLAVTLTVGVRTLGVVRRSLKTIEMGRSRGPR